jgi:hypothetical protein
MCSRKNSTVIPSLIQALYESSKRKTPGIAKKEKKNLPHLEVYNEIFYLIFLVRN